MARGNYQSIYTGQQIDQRLTDVSNKVDKVAGKGLSANDYTNEDKAAVQSVPSKADKVTGAVANNFAGLDANGNLKDSGSKASDFESAGTAASAVSAHNASAAAHGGVEGKVSAIEGKIPSQASSENKLADKAFVNSSINAVAAFYITADASGSAFATKAALLAGPYYNQGQIRELTRNDYALVLADETQEGAQTRYVYDGAVWAFQYKVKDTPFTAVQQAAIDSGISAGLIPSGTTSTNKLTNASDVAAAIAAGAEVFTAIYGSTTYADIMAAHNAGKIVIGKSGSTNGLICYIDNTSTLKAIYFSSQTDYFYMWKVNENNEWSSITREWENVSRKVATLSAGSTDVQYPSAKCVYDATKNKADKTTSAAKTYASGTTYTLVANEIATLDASTAASGDSISIALPANPAVTDCFDIQITLGANVPTINFPEGAKWLGGSAPTPEANKVLEVNVMNGLWVAGSF